MRCQILTAGKLWSIDDNSSICDRQIQCKALTAIHLLIKDCQQCHARIRKQTRQTTDFIQSLSTLVQDTFIALGTRLTIGKWFVLSHDPKMAAPEDGREDTPLLSKRSKPGSSTPKGKTKSRVGRYLISILAMKIMDNFIGLRGNHAFDWMYNKLVYTALV